MNRRNGEEVINGPVIREVAWTFRPRAKMTLTFLDRNQIQTGAVFRIAGIYDISNSMYEMSQVLVKNKDLMKLTGMPAGPFGAMDYIGIDVVLGIERAYYEELGLAEDEAALRQGE